MDWISGELVQSLTPYSLVLLFFLLIVLFFMMGWIRPRSAVEEVRQDRDARLAEERIRTQEWREAHRISEQGRDVERKINQEYLELARTNQSIIQGLRAALNQRGNPE